MQSPTQSPSGPNPGATATQEPPLDTETEAQPAQSDSDEQKEKDEPAAPVMTETVRPQENGTEVQTAETPASLPVTQAVENEPAVQPQTEPSVNSAGVETDSASKPSAPSELVPDTNAKSKCDEKKAKKTDKGVREPRKYIPSKKAMVDPLKMDMSKQPVIPLTSSQLSLQCFECHIIFSDVKSKERHLKLSHPAEYEQCILRNSLFACYVCDRHFTNSIDLMLHQKAHTEKKPFKCPICSEAFNKSSELTFHKKNHYGQDGYECTDCGKNCKTMTALKYHMRKHSGERPYVCKECGKRFSMSKALHKHMMAQCQGEGDDPTADALKKAIGPSSIKYPCSLCKATFKSTRTRQHHMKTKHNMVPATASKALSAEHQGKHNTPIITPISICQSSLLQAGPNGPLQKVDANIDTEQIRRLIESLGNVQRVNQVVILGQLPPHAAPLEVHQMSQLPQTDFMELKPTGSNIVEMEPLNPCFALDQTIILEPITPEGQLENPDFSELGSNITIGENIELTLVQTEKTERPEGEGMHQILQQPDNSAIQFDQIMFQNGVDLEQTVILELIPTEELELPQTVSQNEIPSSSLVNADLQQMAYQTVIDEQANMSATTLVTELELTPLQIEQQGLPYFVPSDTLTHTSGAEVVDSQMQTVSLDQEHPVMDGAAPQETQEKAEQDQSEQEPSEKLPVEGKNGEEPVENLSEVEDPPAKEVFPSNLETKQVPQVSELPVNVMSAQELVKVRKRNSNKAFILQGCMHELGGSIYKDDFQIDATPSKRQRKKKSHLVVKCSPQSKEKNNKKQKKPSQQHQPIQEDEMRDKTPATILSKKKVPPQKKGRKGKKDKKTKHFVSNAERNSPSSTQDSQVQQVKEDRRKNKTKKQKEVAREGVTLISKHKTLASPVFKKKKQTNIMQKDQTKKSKGGKQKKNLSEEEKVETKESAASTDISGTHITQDALLLLKGHKQPRLKVYKLDPSKAPGQTQEASPVEGSTISQKSKDINCKHSTSECTNTEDKKKGGRTKKNQKTLSLLSSLQASRQTPETLPAKPKTTRKRKACSGVETEGVITSHSKRALECKDCGQRFSEVSSLQKHKAMVHIVESPGLTYTNGNIFEGVSTLDLYQLPKQPNKVVGVMNAAADWDTEPEIVEMALDEKERSVSFPALIPSPSFLVPPSDVEVIENENNGNENKAADKQSCTSQEVHLPADQMKTSGMHPILPSEPPLGTSAQTKSSEFGEPLASDENKQEEASLRNPSTESEVQGTTDEDIKENLLLDVDLVTVGEQNDRVETTSQEDSVPQNESSVTCNPEDGSINKLSGQVNNETTAGRSLTSQTVSCSTHQVEIKEEEEELQVQKKKGGKRAISRNATRGRRRETGRLKRDAISKRALVGDTTKGTESEKEQEECQLLYEKRPISSDSEIHDDGQPSINTLQPEISTEFEANKATVPAASLSTIPSTLEKPPEEPVVLESATSTDQVKGVRRLQGGEEHNRDANQSPVIILEKFLTSRQEATADKEPGLVTERNHQSQGFDNIAENEDLESQQIKVEENIPDRPLVAPICQNRLSASVTLQHHRDIRTVLVKEESSLVLNETQASGRHIRWNVEPVNTENTSSPLIESEETAMDESCVTPPEFNTNQCIFYPVKEEEREFLLGAQTNSGNSTTGAFCDAQQTEQHVTDNSNEGCHSAPGYEEMRVRKLSEPGVSDSADRQAEAEAEMQHPPDLRDFLLQSSDEEDVGVFEMSDPQLDSEAEVMAYFYKTQTNSAQQAGSDELSQNMPTTSGQIQAPREETRTTEPIDYFSKYFGWDTWVEIANCTNKISNMPRPVTSREVAQFVGIHVAMGTLKFPSPRLYWENLTKVPLVADSMPLSRFLELSRMLKLACPAKDPVNSNVQEGRCDSDLQNAQQGQPHSSRQSEIGQRDTLNELSSSQTQTDPLWKAQPLLCRFKAGCQSLRQEGDYAVDQYPLPLTGKMHNKKLSLYCTTLVGFGGLLLHVDLKLGQSSQQDAVEKMVPKGSMVFLCKQELSTPAMLERLLVAGVHGAGRVGGARGQIGDEFLSSDGKLMLRRSHCGFILSTAGNNQRNMASLMDNFEKAQMSAQVNRDLQNLYSIPLTASAPTCWPQAVLWYLTDLALVNSWLLYRQDHKAVSAPLTLMAFRLEVSKSLILSNGCDAQDSVPPQTPREKPHTTNEKPNPSLVEESPLPDVATRFDGSGHWPEQLGEGEGGRCRYGDCQRTSRVLCLKCCVFLCISRNHNCFLNFHNQGSLGKE
ncbi:uncharacterized protein LOC117480229 [Trematomus bernacchii]|uniref:uncharacterized protein LOC117480229 n=1 Tax=Trematomus bernacchii TaxID=40690 RepID=UPI00146B6CD8|nr:uncharacterized protein LOC117480229 [Trematomus bernacchii]